MRTEHRTESGVERSVDLSVVIPLYDEADNVAPLCRELVSVLDAEGRRWEVLLVDDGSRDQTFARAREIALRDRRFRVVRLGRNYGQATAIQAGFDRARGGVIVTMDGDLENDPGDIGRLLAGIEEGYDVVCGWRKDRQGSFMARRFPSWIANKIIARLTGVKVHDNGCTLRAYRTQIVRRTSLYSDLHRFLPVLVDLSGGSYKEVVVGHRLRSRGHSKYGLSRTWEVSIDLIMLTMIARFASRPGRWFALLSLPFLLLAALCLIATAILYLTAEGDGFPIALPASAVLFTFALLHLQIMAVIGELVVATGDEDSPFGSILGS